MKILGIIPARYHSTRFPAKALAQMGDYTMIQRVYQQATRAKSLDKVVVATDHQAIAHSVEAIGGAVCYTREDHPTGTDRCQEAMEKEAEFFDYVVNIQGDEPFIHPEQIDELAHLLDGFTELGTLVNPVKDPALLFNPSIMKVLFNKKMEALYFSRTCVPYVRGVEKEDWIKHHTFYKHVCIYAYRADVLKEITRLEVSSLEKAESLEQLRWLENGYTIKIGISKHESMSIDTPEDMERAKAVYGF